MPWTSAPLKPNGRRRDDATEGTVRRSPRRTDRRGRHRCFRGGGSAATKVGTGANAKSKCGLGNGKKARGAPIKLGGIDMLIPGVDFTTIGKVAKAYFDCVNDNGGIRGRPIKYILYNEQLNPAQEAALARKLIESDKVVGVVGNTSFAECGVNWKYYKSKGYIVIGAGVQAECFGTPPIAESNMGPRYSDIGAAQALIRAGVKKIAIASPETISAYADGGVVKLGAAKGVAVKVFPTHLPVTDATSQLLQMYQFAGDGDGIIIDFTPDTAPAFMKAAIAHGHRQQDQVGLVDPDRQHVHVRAVLPAFDGHLWINSEFGLLDASQGPDTRADAGRCRRSTRRRSRRRRSGRWASWTRSSRLRPCSASRARSPPSRTTGGPQPEEHPHATSSASRGTSGTRCRTTSRTTRTSPSTTRTARSC